jgi:hypothetical protein
MNMKSMIIGLVIAVVASTGTYFLLPLPSGAEATNCATEDDVYYQVKRDLNMCM